MKPAALTIALLLAACAKPAPQIQVQPIQCPPVPQCSRPEANIRTIYMKRFFQASINGYDEDNQTLTIDGVVHKVITAELTNFAQSDLPLASCGCSRLREIITLDRQNSPLLMQVYSKYRRALKKLAKSNPNGTIDAISLIDFTNTFMRKNVFNIKFFVGNNLRRIKRIIRR